MVPESRAGVQPCLIGAARNLPTVRVISMNKVRELVRASGLPDSALVVVGTDHRLADPEPLQVMLEACEESKA
jgi:hypothetical protein